MEALFDTCKQLITDITRSCLASELYAEECLKMAKYVAKCALVLTEIELFMHAEQSLRGSQGLFLGVDGMVTALKQVDQLMSQCSTAKGGGVWPLEDAVEFQAVALELQNAMIGLSKTNVQLPLDVQEDLQHFVRQLGELQFTTSELAETEELVEAVVQRTPRTADAAGGLSPFDRPPKNGAAIPPPISLPAAQRAAAAVTPPGEEEPSSPLPDDPFNMDSHLAAATVRELEGLKLRGSGEAGASGSVGEESLLEARADNAVELEGAAASSPTNDEALAGLRELAAAGRASGALEGIAEGAEEGEEEEEGDPEEERALGALVNEVVALMDEGDEEGGQGAAATAKKGGAGGAAQPPEPHLSPAEMVEKLAEDSLEHLAHGDD